MSVFTVIFVCTGNVCRSPVAEGIFKDAVMDDYEKNKRSRTIKIISAGTHAYSGNPASQNAIIAAAEKGINLNYHRSQPITDELVSEADLILTMETAHRDLIQSVWPSFQQIYELKRFGNENTQISHSLDIVDPYGMDIEIYRDIFQELYEEISRISPFIFKIVEEQPD